MPATTYSHTLSRAVQIGPAGLNLRRFAGVSEAEPAAEIPKRSVRGISRPRTTNHDHDRDVRTLRRELHDRNLSQWIRRYVLRLLRYMWQDRHSLRMEQTMATRREVHTGRNCSRNGAVLEAMRMWREIQRGQFTALPEVQKASFG